MLKSKVNLILAVFIIIFATSTVFAQEMKPMAPPIDITGQKIDFPSGNFEIFKTDGEITDQSKVDKTSNKDESEDKASEENPKNQGKEKISQKQDNNGEIEQTKLNKDEKNSKLEDKIKQKIIDQGPTSNLSDEQSENLNTEKSAVVPAKVTQRPRATNVHDNDILKQADDIEMELRIEEPRVLKDLRTLWSAAVEKSNTIRLAIQKLSNPEDGTKDETSMVSKFLSPLANMAPLAAMASSSATQTAGALLGGSMLGALTSDPDSQYNKAFMRVSDYDLIMLARAIDELQSKLVIAYYEYKQSIERLEDIDKAAVTCKNLLDKAEKTNNFAATTAANAFYREALQAQLNAKQSYLRARTELEQITGNDAIVYIETVKEDTQELPSEDNSSKEPGLALPAKKDLTQQTPLPDISNTNTLDQNVQENSTQSATPENANTPQNDNNPVENNS